MQVLQVINPGQMLEANLYKFPQNYENERLGESILSDLNALTKFYVEVSSRGEAVVIVID